MNKNYILTAFAACALLATSCTSDDNDLNNQDQSVSILTTVSGNTALATRTDASNAYTPEGGTLTLLYGSMTAPANEQTTYTCTAGNWLPSGTPLYWNNLTADANGHYPFFAVAPNMPAAAPAVATNQSVAADYTQSDLLLAYTLDAEPKENVSLTFRHVLTQLTVSLNAEDNAADLDLSSATLTAGGAKTAYTLSYDAPTGEVPATATATGDAAATLTPNKAASKFYLVLPPQAVAANALTITITIGDKTYNWENSDALTLAAGKNNTINLTLRKSDLTVTADGIRVTDWDNSPAPVNGNLTINVDGTPDTPTGSAPTFTTIKLWKGQAAFTDNATAPADAKTYTKNANGTWSSDAPFYIDDIATDDNFYTLAENSDADAITGLKELVAAGPVSMKGGALVLNYRHLMTKFRITLNATEGFMGGSIEGATINTPAMSKEFALAYADNTIAAKAQGTADTYNALTPATDYILVPQAVATGSKFIVTLTNGKSYSALLPSDLALEAGKINTLALNFNEQSNEGTLSLSMGVANWEVGASTSATLTVNSSTDDPDDPSGNAPTFTGMKLWKGQAAFTGNTAAPADAKTYTKDATGTWSSTEPFYIDDIAPADHFYGLAENSNADAVTALTELVAAGPVRMKGGALALSYRHLMAKLEVSLIKGAYFPSDITDATITSPAMSKAFILEYAATAQSIVAKATGATGSYDIKATTDANPNSYIVVPQTLAKGSSLTMTLKDGSTYTGSLAADLVIKPGKVHTITLTLNASGIVINVGLTDWVPGNSTSGEMED